MRTSFVGMCTRAAQKNISWIFECRSILNFGDLKNGIRRVVLWKFQKKWFLELFMTICNWAKKAIYDPKRHFPSSRVTRGHKKFWKSLFFEIFKIQSHFWDLQNLKLICFQKSRICFFWATLMYTQTIATSSYRLTENERNNTNSASKYKRRWWRWWRWWRLLSLSLCVYMRLHIFYSWVRWVRYWCMRRNNSPLFRLYSLDFHSLSSRSHT